MIIIHVMGGLGNQLYQYAMYQKLNSLGKDVRLDFHDYTEDAGEQREWRSLELIRFENLDYRLCTKEERTMLLDNSMRIADRIRRKITGRKTKLYEEKCSYDPKILDMDEAYLYGFWECDKYYEGMKFDFRFPISTNKKNQEIKNQMRNENSVSVHIRRTDYLTVADGKRYTGICTEDYYRAAFEYISQSVENPVFYIFSDDPEYAKKTYTADNMHVIDWNQGEDSIFDMELMSNCKYNICANSTFSFWGAKLNNYEDKIIVRPLHHDNYETLSVEEIKDQWKNWVLIDEKGKVY